MEDFLIYGATGFTGRLIAEHAVERGSIQRLPAATRRMSANWLIDCTSAIECSIYVVAGP